MISGSLPPGVPHGFYAEIIRLLNQNGAKTVLDTIGEPLRLGCLEKPFLVKPNTEEARALTGLAMESVHEVAQAAARIQKMGVENVVISMGKTGALLQSAGSAWLVRSPTIAEKNPIGAGDSMVGGMVWALTGGCSLKEALGWGVASGAATASLSGTEVGTRSLIEHLYTQVRYEPVPLPSI